jgi:hypothetical protein
LYSDNNNNIKKTEIMTALTFKIETTTERKELTAILNELDTIVCEIMDNEENEDNWMALKSAVCALNSINKAQTADCGYTMYINTIAAQVWANQAYANVNEDRSI